MILWAVDNLRLVFSGLSVPPKGAGVWRPFALALVVFMPRGARVLVSVLARQSRFVLYMKAVPTHRSHGCIFAEFAILLTISLHRTFSKGHGIVLIVQRHLEGRLAGGLGLQFVDALVQWLGGRSRVMGVYQVLLVSESQHDGDGGDKQMGVNELVIVLLLPVETSG